MKLKPPFFQMFYMLIEYFMLVFMIRTAKHKLTKILYYHSLLGSNIKYI